MQRVSALCLAVALCSVSAKRMVQTEASEDEDSDSTVAGNQASEAKGIHAESEVVSEVVDTGSIQKTVYCNTIDLYEVSYSGKKLNPWVRQRNGTYKEIVGGAGRSTRKACTSRKKPQCIKTIQKNTHGSGDAVQYRLTQGCTDEDSGPVCGPGKIAKVDFPPNRCCKIPFPQIGVDEEYMICSGHKDFASPVQGNDVANCQEDCVSISHAQEKAGRDHGWNSNAAKNPSKAAVAYFRSSSSSLIDSSAKVGSSEASEAQNSGSKASNDEALDAQDSDSRVASDEALEAQELFKESLTPTDAGEFSLGSVLEVAHSVRVHN